MFYEFCINLLPMYVLALKQIVQNINFVSNNNSDSDTSNSKSDPHCHEIWLNS